MVKIASLADVELRRARMVIATALAGRSDAPPEPCRSLTRRWILLGTIGGADAVTHLPLCPDCACVFATLAQLDAALAELPDRRRD
jgi:hypothetical protein